MANTEIRVDVIVPNLGVTNARITVWFVNPGDRVYQGDRLAEVSLAGATVDVPAPVTGRLLQQLVFARDVVVGGQIIGVVVADPE